LLTTIKQAYCIFSRFALSLYKIGCISAKQLSKLIVFSLDLHYLCKKGLCMHLINDNLQKIIALCKKHKVNKLYAFGSILTNRFTDKSDVDMLVDFNSEIDHNTYADNFFEFYYSLKALFGRDVDLVDESAVSNPYFKDELEDTKFLIYG